MNTERIWFASLAASLFVFSTLSAAEYSWQQPHSKVLPTGNLEWAPEMYCFNNLIWGASTDDDEPYRSTNSAYFMVFGFLNQFINNTVYRHGKGIGGSSGNRCDVLGAATNENPIQGTTADRIHDSGEIDFRLVDDSAAVDRGVQYFIPFSLYGTVGEWHFTENHANPTSITDYHWYMSEAHIYRMLYEWQTNGPFKYDFCGRPPVGRRDAGAIERKE